ncbi:MAG: hypothetical protein U9O96_02345, partial [Candidatus Thermoplasmatota archaeon]|nr:hypothetical protein [Candidatus Thermoplasmatota archaeon]
PHVMICVYNISTYDSYRNYKETEGDFGKTKFMCLKIRKLGYNRESSQEHSRKRGNSRMI